MSLNRYMGGRFALLIPLLLAASPVSAQAPDPYPSKPLRFILPFPPGGPTDILGRLIGERLASSLGQPVVVENRGGAGGNVGAEAAAKSAPDGYTLVLVAPSLAISPSLYSKLNYDPLRDFAPVSLVATVPNVIVTQPALAPTLQEFIALAKAKPGGMNFGSGGSGTSNHLAGELFNLVTGAKLVHVPYKGVNLAMNDVLAGAIHLVVIGLPAAAPHIKPGRLRALGVLAPAGTPRPVVARLNGELAKILYSQDMKDKLNAIGTDPVTSTPEEFAAYLRQETEKWANVVRKAGLKAD